MAPQFFIRKQYADVAPFLDSVREQADSEREALGFLPEAAYEEAARQRKLLVLVAAETEAPKYAGHLLFGGIFPMLRVRQICVAPKFRRQGNATTLMRALKAQAENEHYLSIVANVATDLGTSNAFYEANGFLTKRLKSGGLTRRRMINVRALELQTPNLITLMIQEARRADVELIPKNRSQDAPLYVIDLNVFHDALRERARSEEAGLLFEAALGHQIRIAASDELVRELSSTSYDKNNDPVLALARRIPTLALKDKTESLKLKTDIALIVFPERMSTGRLKKQDESDVIHLCDAIAAGAAGYITSDRKILNARDALVSRFNLDIIGLSEFVELIDLPEVAPPFQSKTAKRFRVSPLPIETISSFLNSECCDYSTFFASNSLKDLIRTCVWDDDGVVGIGLLAPSRAIEQPCKSIVCVKQEHPLSSTVADFLISEHVRGCSKESPQHIQLLDQANHPITRRIALSQGFQQTKTELGSLSKVAFGRPVTKATWKSTRLAVERLAALKLQTNCPTYEKINSKVSLADAQKSEITLFDLETLLSPTIFALPKRHAVVVPITRNFADALLDTSDQYSLLDNPEAQFLSNRTYLNTVNAARAMIRGAVIAFYESKGTGGRGAIVAFGRIVDVISAPKQEIPELKQRAAVVEDLNTISSAERILVTTFDNVTIIPKPVTLNQLREIGCVPRSNFVSASPITSTHLEAIVNAGFRDE